MKREGLSPYVATYNALLEGCTREGTLKQMNTIVREFEKRGMEPNNITLNAILCMLVNGDPALIRTRITDLVADTNDGAAELNNNKETEESLSSSKAHLRHPDRPVQIEKALQVLSGFEKAYSCRADETAFYILLDACRRSSNNEEEAKVAKERGKEIIESMQARGITISQATQNLISKILNTHPK